MPPGRTSSFAIERPIQSAFAVKVRDSLGLLTNLIELPQKTILLDSSQALHFKLESKQALQGRGSSLTIKC